MATNEIAPLEGSRDKTDKSLEDERQKTDKVIDQRSNTVEAESDQKTQSNRIAADSKLESIRAAVDLNSKGQYLSVADRNLIHERDRSDKAQIAANHLPRALLAKL